MKIVVVGGGASGLVFSILSARQGHRVTLLEANSRVGKKLMLTGGGRCNLYNDVVDVRCYNDPYFVGKVFENCSKEKYLKVIESFGIFTDIPDGEGRVYPITYSAASVVDCLRFEATRVGVNIVCDTRVDGIITGEGYTVKAGERQYGCDKVVIAVGGCSQSAKTGLADLVGKEYLTKTVPSLSPLTVNNHPKGLVGVRAKCEMTLLNNGRRVASERGEIQFRDFGLSGICTLNLSAYIARARVKGEKNEFDVSVDFLPDFDVETLRNILTKRKRAGYSYDQLLVGLLPNKLAETIKRAVPCEDIDGLIRFIKGYVFKNAETVDYSLSQVTSGGVAYEFVDEGLVLSNGIIVLGEALNVDGLCGGYNLYFAFVSAIVAAERLERYNQEKTLVKKR